MKDDYVPLIVHGYGYRITHVAIVRVSVLKPYVHTRGDGTFYATAVPVTAVCGRQVKSRGPIVEVLPRGFLVRCRNCQRDYGLSPELEPPALAARPEVLGYPDWMYRPEGDQ